MFLKKIIILLHFFILYDKIIIRGKMLELKNISYIVNEQGQDKIVYVNLSNKEKHLIVNISNLYSSLILRIA